MRNKLSPATAQWVNEHYAKYGATPEQRYAAYDRRQERAARFGIDNLNDANAQQIRRAAEAGLIGAQPQQPIASPAGPAVANQGNAFGAGGPKLSGMAAAMTGPGPGGSPTPGRPMVDPAAPVQQAAQQFSPLGTAMSAYAIPRNKRRSFGSTYG